MNPSRWALGWYGGAGFDTELREVAASRRDILLVDPARLYDL
jgi:hypothetical protein